MTRFAFSILALMALAACDPPVPDSGAGVGFGNYNEFQRQQAARDAALQGSALPTATAVSTEPLGATGAQTATSSATPGLTTNAAGTQINADGTVQASPSNPAPVLNSTGISSENDFGAVSAQRSIEGDAALRAQNQQQYQVIQPTALPTRSGATGPNIVQYALRSGNPKGQRVFARSGFNAQAKFQRNCAGFASPDLAQQAFLAAGGPKKDSKGLDPDGDGYACSWDPAPFRRAVNGG